MVILHQRTLKALTSPQSHGLILYPSLCRCAIDDPVFMELLNATPCKPIIYMPQQPPGSSPSQQGTELQEQPPLVDPEGTAESLEKRPQTESRRRAADVPGDTYEHFLLGIAQSLMMESIKGELVLTAHPHTNILPSSYR